MRDYGPWWRDCPSGRVWRRPLPCPQPSAPRGANFIDTKFEHAVYPFRIHVYETYNPGGLVGVWAGFCRGSWRRFYSCNTKDCQRKNISRLWGGQGEGQPNQPRQFSPPIQPTDFPTRQIRLEFDQTCLPYYTEIDAVCLLGTLHPITPSAKVAAMLPARPLPPILGRVVSSGLHVLPPSTEDILEACTDQLSRPAVNLYIRFTTYACPANPMKKSLFPPQIISPFFFLRQLRSRERSPPPADDGFFSFLPRFDRVYLSWDWVSFLWTKSIVCYF